MSGVAEQCSAKLREVFCAKAGRDLDVLEMSRAFHLGSAARAMMRMDLGCIDHLGERAHSVPPAGVSQGRGRGRVAGRRAIIARQRCGGSGLL